MEDLQPSSGNFFTKLDRKWIALLLICVIFTLAVGCLFAANLLITGGGAIGLGATRTRTATSSVNEKTAQSLDNPGVSFEGRYTRMVETLTAAATNIGTLPSTDSTTTQDPLAIGTVGTPTPYSFLSTPTATLYRAPTPNYGGGGYVYPTAVPYYFPTTNAHATQTVIAGYTQTRGPTATYIVGLTRTAGAQITSAIQTVTALAVSPTPSLDRIAYSADFNGGGVLDLLASNLDGTGFTVISRDTGALLDDWSHDRTHLIYQALSTAVPPKMVLSTVNENSTGTGLIPGQPDGDNSDAAYSPNGRWIAFRSQNGSLSGIYAIRADGSGSLRRLTNNAGDEQPDWSTDGARVVFVSNRGGANTHIYVVDAATVLNADTQPATLPTPVQLTSNANRNELHPHISPDSRYIVFEAVSTAAGSLHHLYRTTIDASNYTIGTAEASLTETSGANDTEPSWSWNSNRILFLSDRSGGQNNMFTINLNGGELATLNNPYVPVSSAKWMP